MSNYRNFFSDFSGRLQDLLQMAEPEALKSGREVTLMLAIATPSIVVPYERLSDPYIEREPHPSRDTRLFPRAKAKWDKLIKECFLNSELWSDHATHSWKFGSLASVDGNPDEWLELAEPRPMSDLKKVGTVVKHLRNGLSHGNIFTLGHPEIEKIVILSRVSIDFYKFKFICVSPGDFRTFLFKWLDFVGTLPGAREVVEWQQPEYAGH